MNPQLRPLIAGNWKMNGTGAALAEIENLRKGLAEQAHAAEIVLCPPATLLHRAAQALEGAPVALGGQDCHPNPSGAHTGDVSAPMLAEAGARYVIVGHSERRADHGETDAVVRAKAEAAVAAGLVPIVCVGETEAEREAGAAERVVGSQLEGSVPESAVAGGLVVAYEPVWAIGTGKTPTPAEIADIHSLMRGLLIERFGEAGSHARLLYGGSVKPGNAAELLGIADVNGALVGGASLLAADFLAIVSAGDLKK